MNGIKLVLSAFMLLVVVALVVVPIVSANCPTHPCDCNPPCHDCCHQPDPSDFDDWSITVFFKELMHHLNDDWGYVILGTEG